MPIRDLLGRQTEFSFMVDRGVHQFYFFFCLEKINSIVKNSIRVERERRLLQTSAFVVPPTDIVLLDFEGNSG